MCYCNYIGTLKLMSLIRATMILGFDSNLAWLMRELEALWPSRLGELFVNHASMLQKWLPLHGRVTLMHY
jgi:hypothetical protein